MGDRRPLGPLIPTKDGRYIRVYTDGSQTIFDQYLNVVSDDTTPNPQRAALLQSGDEEAVAAAAENASTENRRRFDATLENQQTQLKQNYQIALRNARTNDDVARANAEYQAGQLELARGRLGLDTELGRGNLQLGRDRLGLDTELGRGRLGLDTELGRGNLQLGQARLGLDTLSESAKLRGPLSAFQSIDFERGAAQQQSIPMFLQGRQPGYVQNTNVPTPATLGGLSQNILGYAGVGAPATGVGSVGSGNQTDPQYQASLDTIKRRALNPHSEIAAGEWESWSPDEQDVFLSGVAKAGMSERGFLTRLARSRIGQGGGNPMAA